MTGYRAWYCADEPSRLVPVRRVRLTGFTTARAADQSTRHDTFGWRLVRLEPSGNDRYSNRNFGRNRCAGHWCRATLRNSYRVAVGAVLVVAGYLGWGTTGVVVGLIASGLFGLLWLLIALINE